MTVFMKPQTCELRNGSKGDEVRSLHETSKLIGLEINEAERKKRNYGPATEIIVRKYQPA